VTFTLGHVGKANHPGEYLQARRARVTPAEVGLVPGPRRRLARLRRDELAMLAANPIARALSPGLQVGQNLSRWPFVDPAAKQVFPIGTKRPPWPSGACGKAPPTIPTARTHQRTVQCQRAIQATLGTGRRGYLTGSSHLRHPDVGDLYLTRTQLDVAQSPGQYIITLRAQANSTSARAIDKPRALPPNNSVLDR